MKPVNDTTGGMTAASTVLKTGVKETDGGGAAAPKQQAAQALQ
jgi:hypothetical protein